MPEGDSLHRVAAQLQVLVGERVAAEAHHPRAALTRVAPAVDGKVLEAVEAVGKNLLLRFEDGITLRSHLRMSGRWRVEPCGRPHAGRPWLVLRGREWQAVQWNGPVLTLHGCDAIGRLGPDILAHTTDIGDVVRRLRRSDPRRPVGELLVDQRVVAGIGNLCWRSAWRASVSPFLPVGQATDDELETALDSARSAMRRSVAGDRPRQSVYRRACRPCARCGALIRSRGIGDANRTAYWCPGCQRGPLVSQRGPLVSSTLVRASTEGERSRLA